jgi:hypothetical protein
MMRYLAGDQELLIGGAGWYGRRGDSTPTR